MKRSSSKMPQRFWEKCAIWPPTGCWIWQGGLTDGYGNFSWARPGGIRSHRAHRLAYQLTIGPIPDGCELDHLCRNKACINPAHLEPVSHVENMRRSDVGWNYRMKTHCPSGHPYDAKNTYYFDGERSCRACHRVVEARRRLRKANDSLAS